MSSDNNNNNKKKVLILGAGYAGTSVAKSLDKVPGIDVTVVAPNEGYMVHKIGALRAAVKGGSW